MATGNGLVMQGSSDGYLNIYDARSGKILRRIRNRHHGRPVAYAIGGTQYVSVAAGFGGGGGFNSYFLPGWAARDRENNPRLILFKLDGAPVTLAPLRTATPLLPAPGRFRGTPPQVARGGALFGANCARCHVDSTGSGGYPNLGKMTPETHDAFDAIVLDGSFAYAAWRRLATC